MRMGQFGIHLVLCRKIIRTNHCFTAFHLHNLNIECERQKKREKFIVIGTVNMEKQCSAMPSPFPTRERKSNIKSFSLCRRMCPLDWPVG